jgi:hypothetical protein
MLYKNLDEKIILYSSELQIDYLSYLNKITEKAVEENIWQISSIKNINETDITANSKIFYLPPFDNFFLNLNYNFLDNVNEEKAKFRLFLNKNILPYILDYSKRFDLKINNIHPWSICENINNDEFHNDEIRNNFKNEHTVVVALNDNYEGGYIQFENRIGNELITMTTGQVLIYPSSDEYRHKEFPVTSGAKYNAITYF